MRHPKVVTMLLAGGVGERLYPLTANRSKPAVPFGGNYRIIDFTLMSCVLSGLRRIHVLTQYHSVSLERHRSERWNFLSRELGEFIELVPPKLRTSTGFYHGTAHAIYRNLELLDRHRPDVVLVLSGDHVYRADYQRFIDAHIERDADATVLTDWVDEDEASSFGVIEGREGRIERFIEKPRDPSPWAVDGRCQINLGVYCFNTRFLVEQLVEDGKRRTAHDFGKNILPASLDRGVVGSCALECVSPDEAPYWRDVGTLDSYYDANMDCLEDPGPFSLRDPRWPEGSRFLDWLPSRLPGSRTGGGRPPGRNLISSGCDVAAAHVDRSVLSPGVSVGERSEVDGCILLPGARVGRNARLRRVIVEQGVSVPDGAVIRPDTATGPFVRTEGGVVVVGPGFRFDEPASHARPVRSRSLPRRKAGPTGEPPKPATSSARPGGGRS